MINLKKRKIKEFVTFVPGINPTRAQEQFKDLIDNYYDRSSFDADYNHEDVFLEEETNQQSFTVLLINLQRHLKQ